MSTSQKIGTIEAIALIVIIIINQIILNLPNTIITSTGSSSWLNVIYITIIAIIFCSLICKLFKPFNSNDILGISEYLGGKTIKSNNWYCLLCLFIYFICWNICLDILTNCIKLIYFKDTPTCIFIDCFFFFLL